MAMLANMTGQMHVAALAAMPEPAAVGLDVVISCATLAEAMEMSWSLRRPGLDQKTACRALGICPQHFGGIVKGQKFLPPHYCKAYCKVVGNTLLIQWLALFQQQLDSRIRKLTPRGASRELAGASRAA